MRAHIRRQVEAGLKGLAERNAARKRRRQEWHGYVSRKSLPPELAGLPKFSPVFREREAAMRRTAGAAR